MKPNSVTFARNMDIGNCRWGLEYLTLLTQAEAEEVEPEPEPRPMKAREMAANDDLAGS